MLVVRLVLPRVRLLDGVSAFSFSHAISLCCLLLVVLSLSSMSVFYQGVFCLVLHVDWILVPVIVYSTLDAVPMIPIGFLRLMIGTTLW